eukprot:g30581.t1
MRSNRGSLLALAFTLLAGAAFIAPQSPSRREDRSQVKQTENKMKLGGVWDAIDAVDAYTKKGSGSIQGPLAGVPWLTVIYFVIFFWPDSGERKGLGLGGLKDELFVFPFFF